MSDTTQGAIAQNSGTANTIDNSGKSWSGSTWNLQLQPGSWRGVPFVTDTAPTRAGRRVAIHEYPYRDTAWVEDLGKLPRRFQVSAFLVGDDVYAQRDRMVAASEQAGSGTLVHPTFGSVQCVLLDFQCADSRDRGRTVDLQFNFLLASDLRFPDVSTSTGSAVDTAATNVDTAASHDLTSTSTLEAGAPSSGDSVPAIAALAAVPEAAASMSGFTSLAVAAVNDAARALNAVRGLTGFFGRFAGGKRATALPATATVASVLADAATSRSAVLEAAALVDKLASGADAAYAAAATALAAALLAATNDPADAVRLLVPLSAWAPEPLPGTGALSTEARAAQDAIADTLRCAASAALGRATRAYRPGSYQDAQALRKLVCDALRAQATRCADAGRTESYEALRELRAAVALDLAVRGANLALLVEISTPQSMPSLAEAWTLYADTSREPNLVDAAQPPHPLFMPLDFAALDR